MNKKLIMSILAGFMAAVLLLGIILSVLPTPAKAVSSGEIKEQIKELEEQNKELESELKKLEKDAQNTSNEIEAVFAQKSAVEQQVGLLHLQIDNMNEQISAYSVLIADKQEELDEAESRLVELTEKNKERIRLLVEDGEMTYWSVLLESTSFSDLLNRMFVVAQIQSADQRRIEEMTSAADEVQKAKAELQVERKELQTSKEEMAQIETQLAEKKQQAQDLLQSLIARGEEFELMMDKYEQELAELEKEIAAKEEEYDDKVYEEYMATMTTAPRPTYYPGNGKGGKGGTAVTDDEGIVWIVPCNYSRVASPFGDRIHPVYKVWRFHAGVDLAVECPDPIYASRAGIVTISKYSSTAGYYVTIDHLDGFKTTYMHMCDWPEVKVGEWVDAGQIIGCIGSTGTSTGDHLHFGIYKDGEPVNPMDYIE